LQLEGVPSKEGFITVDQGLSSAGRLTELLSTEISLVDVRAQADTGRLLGLPHPLSPNAVLLVDPVETSRKYSCLRKPTVEELAAGLYRKPSLLAQRGIGCEVIQMHLFEWLAFPYELLRSAWS